MADAAVAELHEVLEGRGRAAPAVEAHRRPPRLLGLHHHDVLVRAERIRRRDLEQEVAVDRAGAQRLERLRLPVPVVLGVDEDHDVARRRGGALRAAQHAAEERVRHVGDQQGDGARRAEPQRLRRDVRPVAELAGAAAHALLRWPRIRGRGPCPRSTSETVDCETSAQRATSMLVTRWMRSVRCVGTQPRARLTGLTDAAVIRSMLIRMTGYRNINCTALIGRCAGVGRSAGRIGRTPCERGAAPAHRAGDRRIAGRDGRELVDPRLRDVDADVRLPAQRNEARTNVRYFDALGYRVVVAGPTGQRSRRRGGRGRACTAQDLPGALTAANASPLTARRDAG